jgi:metallo-beta-lactamase family protein
LGSSIIEIWIDNGEKVKLVFSGDLGNPNQAIVKDPSIIEEADYVFIESTYGDRLHKKAEDPKKILGEIIRTIQKDGGNIIIPSFAVGRTQEIIYNLTELLQEREIAPLPVFIDSPLAIEATKIFQENTRVFDAESHAHINKGIDPLSFPGLQFTVTPEESQKLNRVTSGSIIISASGMCEAGRIKHHLKHHLWRQKSHVVFVGYQAEGTMGRKLVDGAKRVRIFGEEIKVAAHIHNIEGFSAHADKNELLHWLSSFKTKIKQVFVVHGEEQVSLNFAEEIRTTLDIPVHVPVRMEKVMLAPYVVSMEWHVEDQPVLTPDIQHVLEGLEDNLSAFKGILEKNKLTTGQQQLLADKIDQYLNQLNDLAEDCENNHNVS